MKNINFKYIINGAITDTISSVWIFAVFFVAYSVYAFSQVLGFVDPFKLGVVSGMAILAFMFYFQMLKRLMAKPSGKYIAPLHMMLAMSIVTVFIVSCLAFGIIPAFLIAFTANPSIYILAYMFANRQRISNKIPDAFLGNIRDW